MIWFLALACRPEPADTAPIDTRPPEICREPAAIDGPFFTEATEARGLAYVADDGVEDPHGNRLTTVDYDGDGWYDLLIGPVATHVTQDFTTEGGRHNFLLRNEGGTFRDVTAQSGLTLDRDGDDDRSFQTAVWGDVDNDGDLDLFTGFYYDKNNEDGWPGDYPELLLNDGAGGFTLAPPSDLELQQTIAGASFTDYDRDGFLDLWIVSWYDQYGASWNADPDRLLRGNGDGTFTDVTEAVGLKKSAGNGNPDTYATDDARKPGYGATTCDVDDDGDPDLLASNYARMPNDLWRNDDGVFVSIGVESGYATDGDEDFSDNQYYRCWCEVNGCDPDPGPAALSPCSTYAAYWSPGWDDQWFRLGGNTFTTVCGDVDNDGDMDLYDAQIVHWHIGDSSDASELLLNDGAATFTRPGNDTTGLSRPRQGDWNEGDVMAAFFDADNDGWKDVLLASTDYPDTHAWLWRQTAPATFEEVGTDGGLDHPYASGLGIADFDRDGDDDVVLGTSTARGLSPTDHVRFWENGLGGNRAVLRLVGGEGTNRAAIGARVTVEADGNTQTFEVSGGYGHVGLQHTTDVAVGLGAACNIDRVAVRWPDAAGTVEQWTDVRGNYVVVLEQGGGVSYLEQP